jgi:UDP-N-acetylmuramate dehydrogenase
VWVVTDMSVPSAGSSGESARPPGHGSPVTLAELTTFHVGGPAAGYLRAETSDALIDAVSERDLAAEPVLLLGGGSNLLVADEGFDGTVVHVASRGITQEATHPAGGLSIRVSAGEPWDHVVRVAVDQGWSGLEALSGIPGATGSTPIQNVGAYGREIGDLLVGLRVWDRQDRRVRTLSHTDCEFGYRTSRFKRERFRGGPRFAVLEITLQVQRDPLSAPVRYAELARGLGVRVGDRALLGEVRQAVLELRRSKGMVVDPQDHDTWSAGSFFTNPIVDARQAELLPPRTPRWPMDDGWAKVSAAWLIENAGFGKGHGLPGPAALSRKHTLALTNRGQATAEDLLRLARQIQQGVLARFGVLLRPEPVFVGCEL